MKRALPVTVVMNQGRYEVRLDGRLIRIRTRSGSLIEAVFETRLAAEGYRAALVGELTATTGGPSPRNPRNGQMAFSAQIVGDELVLRIPMNPMPEKSSSGKTLVVASTYGSKETDCVVDGKKVIVGVNAYIPKR